MVRHTLPGTGPLARIATAWLAAGALLGCHQPAPPAEPVEPAAASAPAALIERGRYLATAADCAACHDGAEHQPLAGGLPVNSPFGPIYAPNLTPDPVHGIGRYTYEQFDAALRRGVRADGARLYPAMPYASYAKLDDADTRALYAYLMHGVTPSSNAVRATRLPFPFDQRWGLAVWSALFGNHARFVPSPARSAAWNRGAYLVQGAGHCGACHTPRGPAYNERGYDEHSRAYLTGGLNDHWFAPNLTGAPRDGLGRWSADDIAGFLATGHARGGAAFGAMAPVVTDSTSRLTDGDRRAIAVYLKSLPAQPTAATNPFGIGLPRAVPAGPAGAGGRQLPGAGLYASFCARCHGTDGGGRGSQVPPLAGNPVVVADDATSAIRIVVEGYTPPPGSPGPAADSRAMPAMAGKLSSDEIAEVLSFVRGAWGNRAAPVATREVQALRAAIHR
ncbi:cytochrome c [Burkholderia glumae]|uniref:cytochrome c n=1 Tax=Burkholderia glumae TaxID=337 RepID=UPI001373D9A7|nr:cytochrome c [Burkholderia glumae]QHP90032.1 cytochrome c [Burkholderia glumae]